MASFAPHIVWPAVVVGGLLLHLTAGALGVPVQLAAYAAVAVGAGCVTALERTLPYRRRWRPGTPEVATDLVYLALVQVALPVVLALTLAAGAAQGLLLAGLQPSALWPHAWPVAAQAVAMLLLADLLRYVMHVAAHHWEPLWRLHAVHHAPKRLYWLNVARFHPLEKALQYGLDALPFVLVGVAPEVLALYFVFYAINGFFQHSNVDVRLGALNYVVAGPELHRWHHSRHPDESRANYGNNLILWDLLFGTRFLPRGRSVGGLGLLDRSYPMGFVAQLRAPFTRGLDQANAHAVEGNARLRGLRRRALNLLLRAHMALIGATLWRPVVRAARRPAETQRDVLLDIVARNRDARFGREHGFASIRSVDDFQRSVPVQCYESLRPYVEAQAETGEPWLTTHAPVLYAQTSGTTGTPKYVPLLERSLQRHKRLQNLYAYVQYRADPAAFSGRIVGIVSPAVEGRLSSGQPYGSASGHLYGQMPRVAREKYVLPPEVFEVEEYDVKYRLILQLAVVADDVTAMATANPSTFLKLLEVLAKQRHQILADAERGGFGEAHALPEHVRAAVAPGLVCGEARLRELRRVLACDRPRFADLWPGLRLVSTWTGGSCGIALESVRRALPERCRVVELGYLASELRGTVTVGVEGQLGLPALRETFFEFVEKERCDAPEPELLTLDRLEEGREYYVIVTTDGGLYRYAMNDIVRVTGHFEATPTLCFVQKGKGTTSITGEKLYEGQVLEAVTGALDDLGLRSPFFVALAAPEEARYRLLVELRGGNPQALAERVDAQLCEINVEYGAKRKSGRLGELRVAALREGAGEAHKRFCIERGQREGQFKTLALQRADDFAFGWRAWLR